MHVILLVLLIPLIILFLSLIVFCVLLYKNKPRAAFVVMGVCVFLFAVISLVPFPIGFFQSDYTKELGEPFVDGTWTMVYRTKDPMKLLKQVGAPYVKHVDFSHVMLPTPFRVCKKYSCALPTWIAHNVSTYYMMKSLKRIQVLQEKIPYFARIDKLDLKKKRYEQEFVPHALNADTCPSTWIEQLNHLNCLLEEHKVFLDDVHVNNFGVTDDGMIKIFDCEVYTDKELLIQQWLLNIIDGSQQGKARGYANAPRILRWNDGRKGIDDFCKDVELI